MSLFALLTDVLFVGHSLVGPTLPSMLEAALRQSDATAQVQAQIINGAPLIYNWDHAADAEGIDARARLTQGPVDVLILTEAQPIAEHVKFSATAENVAKFAGLAYETNPDTRVYLYETWPSLNSGADWHAQIARELPLWQEVAAQASTMTGHEIKLIPAGQAMAQLSEAISKGAVPEITDIREMFSDDIHLSGKGLYFVAVVQAAVINGTSPEGLPAKLGRSWASRDAVITDAQALAFQKVAWAAVSGYQPPQARIEPIKAAPTVTPDAPLPSFAPITNTRLALGLAGVNDWSVQQPFLDVMKTARPWVGHKPNQWGGWEEADLRRAGALDPQGWPRLIPPEVTGLTTLILTDLPADALGVAGRYLLRYQGKGSIDVTGRGQVVETTDHSISFDYTPGEGAVMINISALDATDPIHNISVVRASRASDLDADRIFNPDWLARLRGVRGVRFMDWMATNNSTLSQVKDRPQVTDYSYARIGVPAEIMVALANELQADAWFNIPHLASDDLVRTYAQIVHDGLDPTLKAQVEFSNEVWNWQFDQAKWAESEGQRRWGEPNTWVQLYGMRAAQVADIWRDTFADAPERLTRIVSMQTGWLGLEEQILDAPLWVKEGHAPPAQSFDAYAVTGYFSALLGSDQKTAAVKDWLAQSAKSASDAAAAQGLTGAEADVYAAAHIYDLADKLAEQELRDGSVTGERADSLAALLTEVLPYHTAVAADRGLKLMMYEGGTHVVGFGAQVDDPQLVDFFTHLNFTPQMGQLYAELLAGWQLQSDQPFNAFVDVYPPGKWGSWGALRHLGDDNPRWDALAKGCTTC